MKSSITEVVLTGGPCSGKSSAKAYIAERLADYGVRTFFIPEAASMVIDPGLPDIGKLAQADFARFCELQKHLIGLQQDLRRHYRAIAAMFPAERCLIVSDRGPCDAAAYIGWDAFMVLLNETGQHLAEVRDNFAAAIHLVTAAKGAEAAYTVANNAARREGLAEARAADDRTLAAWNGHPHLIVIDNATDFEAKMNRTIQALARVLGIPVPIEDERKYLLLAAPPDLSRPELTHSRPIEIVQHYLLSQPGEQRRIRSRTDCGHSTYFLTIKQPTGRLGRNLETNQLIGHSQYLALLREADPGKRPIRKRRRCFVWRQQYFELDEFYEDGFWQLELELTEDNQSVQLPPWLGPLKEVTNDPAYYNVNLATKATPL